ncbi:MAG: hypothetical protein K2J16_05630 [Clostridia bacterium]|nr:hypothetical protein [Clostridia bacterium]
MAKTIDYIALTITVLLLTFVWSTLLFKNWIVSIIFTVAFTAALILTVRFLLSKRDRPYTYDRLALEFSIKGNGYVVDLLKSVLKHGVVDSGANFILLEKCLIISAVKFSMLSISDMGSICALAGKYSGKRVYVIARGIDRRAYSIVQLENVNFTLVKVKTIYKFLHKHHALPDLKPIKSKFSIRAFIDAMFCRSNFKSYLFSGAVLILASFLTPLKIYYIVLGSISLLFAILTLTPLGNGTMFSIRVMDELEQAAAIKDDQMSIDEISYDK